MRILVAEDERITRASLVRQLEAWGHTVSAAEDGERAWARFNDGDFDVVITDWEMPGLSGVEFIRRIRAAAGARFVYIIMLTGRTAKADLVSGIEAGADDFVSKPFDREELRVRLLAGERIVTLERTLNRQNADLREAGERMRHDLEAASRVQRAMLPREDIVTPHVRTAWTYAPTDALAGDGIGLHLIEDRRLVAYVLDVSGHGVPAALLSVTAMHALAPAPEGTSLLRDMSASGAIGTVQRPSRIAYELNRRFRSDQSDGRFFTLVLCVLDTRTGMLHVGRAGHAPPLILRSGTSIPLADAGGLPIAVVDDAEFEEAAIQLAPGDRVYLYSDGIVEQTGKAGGGQFGIGRLQDLLGSMADVPDGQVVLRVVEELARWSGARSFTDDVSLVVVEWLGA